jgi:CHASE2 domain-containing sensor protein
VAAREDAGRRSAAMKRARDMTRRDRERLGLMAAVAVASVAVAVAAYATHLLAPLEYRSIDSRFSIRGTQRAPANVVVVGIDNATLNELPGTELGRPPYPRRLDALLIDHLLAAGARVVVVDLDFLEPTDTRDDNALIRSVEHAHGRVLLADVPIGPGGSTPVLGGILPNIGARAGFAGLPLDSDGVLRSYPYSVSGSSPTDCCLDSVAVAAVELFTHRHVPSSLFPGGTAPIDYAGPRFTVHEIPFVDVSGVPLDFARSTSRSAKAIAPSFPRGAFRGKIVVVGASATFLQDIHTTAFGPEMSGPEVWANAISTLLRRNPLRYASGLLDILLVAVLAVVGPLARLRLRTTVALGLAVALAAGYALATQLAFEGGTILSFVYPVFGLLFGTASSQAADAAFERRHNRRLQTQLDRLPGEQAAFLISYRREQSRWPAHILTGALTERFGEHTVFKDTDSISAGEQWPQRIEDAVGHCDVMLVLIGPRWIDAAYADGSRRLDDPEDWVRREIESGLAASCAVVPVLLDGALMPDDDALPPSLRPLVHRNAYSLTPEHWDEQLVELLASIQEGRIRAFLAAEAAAGTTPAAHVTPQATPAPASAPPPPSAASAPPPPSAASAPPPPSAASAPPPPSAASAPPPPPPRARAAAPVPPPGVAAQAAPILTPPVPRAAPSRAPSGPPVPPPAPARRPPAPAATSAPVPPPAIPPPAPSRAGATTSTPLGRRPNPTTGTAAAVMRMPSLAAPQADAPSPPPGRAERPVTASTGSGADPPAPAPAPAPAHPRIPRRPR